MSSHYYVAKLEFPDKRTVKALLTPHDSFEEAIEEAADGCYQERFNETTFIVSDKPTSKSDFIAEIAMLHTGKLLEVTFAALDG